MQGGLGIEGLAVLFDAQKPLDMLCNKKYNVDRLRRCMTLAKMGRPKAEKPKNYRVAVRITEEEYIKLKACADKNNLTITQAVRNCIAKMIDSKQ